MIDRLLRWLAYRPFSDRPWLEDVYVWASVIRWERAKRKAGHPKLTGPAHNSLRRRFNHSPH